MIEKSIKLYEFKELKPEIKEKVINTFRENLDFYFLKDILLDRLKQKLKENKIEYYEDLNVFYDLSYSQGSGCCFVGTFEKDNITYKIKHYGRYNHYNSKIIEAYNGEGEEINTTEFNDLYVAICYELEKIGYDYIAEEEKEENIIETIEANEYYFRENGTIE